MTTNLELVKSPDIKHCFYMTDAESKFIEYDALDAGGKTIFDELVTALKTEYANDQLSMPITNTDGLTNENLDLLFAVNDATLTDNVNTNSADYTALSVDLQNKLSAFVVLANSL